MKAKAIILVFLFCCIAGTGFSQVYYVSNGGDDNQNGSSIAQAFATIQHAADVAAAGSTVYVVAGTYAGNIGVHVHSGTAGSPITFKNYNGGAVYIDGGGTAAVTGSSLMSIYSVNYITIDGFIFQNAIQNNVLGLVITETCDHITVRNCTFTNIHFSNNPSDYPGTTDNVNPLIVRGTASLPITNVLLRNNAVYNCRTGRSEGITVNGNVDGFIIDSNTVHDITNIGIVAAGHYGICADPASDQARNGSIRHNTLYACSSPVAPAGAIYIDGGKNIVVENNSTHHGQTGISIGCEHVGKTADNIVVRNNFSYRNARTGIEIGGFDYPLNSGEVTGSFIYGNTCYKNDTGSNWAGEINITHCDNLVVNNNIFCADNGHNVVFNYYANNGTGNTFDYNLFYTPGAVLFTFNGSGYGSFAAYRSGTGNDAHSLFTDPQFKNTAYATLDLHLKPGSPAINAGNPAYTPAAGETDIDGEVRNNGTIDCGADETYYPTGIAPAAGYSLHIFPDPAAESLSVEIKNAGQRELSFEMIDVYGRVFRPQVSPVADTYFILDIRALAPGTYFLVVAGTGYLQRTAFIKL